MRVGRGKILYRCAVLEIGGGRTKAVIVLLHRRKSLALVRPVPHARLLWRRACHDRF
ncbi:hypothetical protein GWL_06000 [Herbaspirillum sp. GW103]|nr:hypothetical protein GWL_06000 [Herbaspirillum sp. GW103]